MRQWSGYGDYTCIKAAQQRAYKIDPWRVQQQGALAPHISRTKLCRDRLCVCVQLSKRDAILFGFVAPKKRKCDAVRCLQSMQPDNFHQRQIVNGRP
jgi:hypothetical protein